MLIDTVFLRFFRSFNIDYLRKNDRRAQSKPWEQLDGTWQPFVEVPLESSITTVVGANESGKSQLLAAVDRALRGQGIQRTDMCRHSEFFRVREGQLRSPDIGLKLKRLNASEREALGQLINADIASDEFFMFRFNAETATLYLAQDSAPIQLSPAADKQLTSLLPELIQIDARVALPSSVPIDSLGGKSSVLGTRKLRRAVFDALEKGGKWQNRDGANLTSSHALLRLLLGDDPSPPGQEVDEAELDLAKKLLFAVAGVDKAVVKELSAALKNEQDGHAQGIIDQINRELADRLNFPAKWAQDQEFKLTVGLNEFDLVFTISDRTGTHYTFSERSHGLRYFLSYYVQFLAQGTRTDGKAEVLLMDEPDAFLSSQGQQDLVQLFEDFTNEPQTMRQVVFVTHSPFLIDKNRGHRIRVLEKGSGNEGTRIVKDASRNHYEPLRSAFGTYVGESTFIGNSNLLVEGLSDQILLVAVSSFLRSQGAADAETLDLNGVTIAPAGGASNLPYLVYLARGRDIEQPALVVLHDSDAEGEQAAAEIKKGPRGKPILHERFVFSIADAVQGSDLALEEGIEVREPEDLIPLGIAASALNLYADAFFGRSEAAVVISREELTGSIGEEGSVFPGLRSAVRAKFGPSYKLEKVAFAREVGHVLEALEAGRKVDGVGAAEIGALKANFSPLFLALSDALGSAIRERMSSAVSRLVERSKSAFLRDHPHGARREEGRALIQQISEVLDDSLAADLVRQALGELRREFNLERDLALPIADFTAFSKRLNEVSYTPKIATQDPDRPGEILGEVKKGKTAEKRADGSQGRKRPRRS